MKSEIKDNLEPADMAAYIDHTLLKADARGEDIDALCGEAKEYRFCSVCVNTTWVGRCAANLRGTGVKVCCVVGFPLGAMVSAAKAFETQTAVAEGATEVDMVINIGALKDRDLALVEGDIRGVKKACGKALLKVIIETALLTTEEIVLASEIVKKAGADFVKTSTGFSTHGATVEHVALMRKTVGPDMGVKAAGGVRTFEDAVAMIKAGATRLGTSGGVKIVQGKTIESGY